MNMKRTEATPPQIMTAQDVLAKMREGIKSTGEIRIRGQEFHMRILSMDEMNQVRREGNLYVSRTPGADNIDRDVFMEKAILKLASTINGIPSIIDKMFEGPNGLRTDEVNLMYEEYMKIMDDVNPAVEMLSEEKLRELIDAVKKNSVSAKDLSLLQLRTAFSLFKDLIQKLDAQPSPKDS